MNLELKAFNNTKEYQQYKGQSGIYAFIYNNEVIYVGQSIDIHHRLLTHHAINSNIKRNKNIRLYVFMKKYIDDIYFLVLPTEVKKLTKTERAYITKYKPRFNYKGVKVPF